MSASRRATAILVTSLASVCLLAPSATVQDGKKQPSSRLNVTRNSAANEFDDTVSATVALDNSDPSTAVPVTLSRSPANGGTIDPATITASTTAQAVTRNPATGSHPSGSARFTITPSPPPRYEIKYIYVEVERDKEVSHIIPRRITEMNNLGQLVGWYVLGNERRAFLYDPLVTDNPATPIGEAWDLRRLVNPSTIDPELTIASAVSINNKGDIVGYVQSTRSGRGTRDRQAYAMSWDTAAGKYTVHLIPKAGRPSTWATRINESGDVLGSSSTGESKESVCWLYNPGWYDTARNLTELALPCDYLTDVLSDADGNCIGPAAYGNISDGRSGNTVHRILPLSGTTEHFRFDGRVADVNGAGVFCGTATAEVPVRKSLRLQKVPYLHANGLKQIGEEYYSAVAINLNQDALVPHNAYREYAELHHSDFGRLNLDDLVIGTDEDVSYWLAAPSLNFSDMSDRASSVTAAVSPEHFGQICGKVSVRSSEYRYFVLTSVAR